MCLHCSEALTGKLLLEKHILTNEHKNALKINNIAVDSIESYMVIATINPYNYEEIISAVLKELTIKHNLKKIKKKKIIIN